MALGLLAALLAAMPSFAQSVAVTVNGTPITDAQVAARARLLQMEGNRSGTRGATDQLIDEAIKMTEAKRMGITVSNAEVDNGILQVARNIKVSQDKLIQMLQQGGVNPETLRDRLRATLAWNAVTEAAVAPNVQISDLELDQQAESRLADYQNFDYILKEIIFIGGGGRSGQANNYRGSFAGCDSAVQLSLTYTDAAVIDVGRRHATQMPEAVARELAGLNVGGITKPRAVENGLSMLAVCEKTQAEDLTFVKDELRNEAGAEAMQNQADEYLATLRKQAKIVYN